MIYLTFSDPPSGVYAGQVIEACRFLQKEMGVSLRLVALISVRGFFQNRAKIRAALPGAIVLPMFPRMRNWRINRIWIYFVCLFGGEKEIIARGPFATGIALSLRDSGRIRKVIFDARGAYHAELTEYKVVEDEQVVNAIRSIEAAAVLRADFRLAVSQKLVEYWQSEYAYSGTGHAVVPCTLSGEFLHPLPPEEEITKRKSAMGFRADEIVIVFSGSSAGWQSFSLVDACMLQMMERQPEIRVVLLAKEISGLEIMKRYPQRVMQQWLPPHAVRNMLLACDYGMMIREDSVTNRVASPVKFAEYLSCGLKVLISAHIGDDSARVREQALGHVIEAPAGIPLLTQVSFNEKKRMHDFAMQEFVRPRYKSAYLKMLGRK